MFENERRKGIQLNGHTRTMFVNVLNSTKKANLFQQ